MASASSANPTHFSSSAPEPNQVQSQWRPEADIFEAATPKGINYSCTSNEASAAASATPSIEVRSCHRSFSSKRGEVGWPRGCLPEVVEGGRLWGHKLRKRPRIVLYVLVKVLDYFWLLGHFWHSCALTYSEAAEAGCSFPLCRKSF